MWTNDSKRILLEHFDAIHNSPSYLYHSALPFCPSSSWLCECYIAELSQEVRVVIGLQKGWGVCSRTVLLDSKPSTLSYSNNTVAIGSVNNDILILDAITGSQTAVLHGHTSGVGSVAFSLDGTSLVSGSEDKTAKLWDMQTGGIVETFIHKDAVCSVSISADNTTIASGSQGGTIYLWNIQTGACHKTIQQEGQIHQVIFSPKDPQILISASGETVQQWDIDGHKVGPAYDGHQIVLSPDGTQLMLYINSEIQIQNTDSGEPVATIYNTGPCCFSPDGRLIANACGMGANILDFTRPYSHHTESLVGHRDDITSLVFSSHCTLISISQDKSVKFWQLGTSSTDHVVTHKKSIPLTPAPTRPVALKAKNGLIIPSDFPVRARKTWGILPSLCNRSLQIPAEDSHQSSNQLNDNKLIFVWYTDSEINIWDAEKGELLQTINIYGLAVNNLWISGDGSKVFCQRCKSIQAWDIWTREVVGWVEFEKDIKKILMIDGLTVWVDILDKSLGYPFHSQVQGWDFGVSSPSPHQVFNELPSVVHLNDAKLWETSTSRMKDIVTGKVVFQLPERFEKPVHVQWGGQYLVISFPLKEVVILDFCRMSH